MKTEIKYFKSRIFTFVIAVILMILTVGLASCEKSEKPGGTPEIVLIETVLENDGKDFVVSFGPNESMFAMFTYEEYKDFGFQAEVTFVDANEIPIPDLYVTNIYESDTMGDIENIREWLKVSLVYSISHETKIELEKNGGALLFKNISVGGKSFDDCKIALPKNCFTGLAGE